MPLSVVSMSGAISNRLHRSGQSWSEDKSCVEPCLYVLQVLGSRREEAILKTELLLRRDREFSTGRDVAGCGRACRSVSRRVTL